MIVFSVCLYFQKMSWKMILSFVVMRFVPIFSQNATDLTRQQQEIQNSIFYKLEGQTRLNYVIKTPPNHNVRFVPLALFTSRSVMEIRNHYESRQIFGFPKNMLLDIGYSFARYKDTLEQSSSVKVKLKNAIFYDKRSTNEQYLNDVVSYYQAEDYEMSFDSNNTEFIFALFNEWMLNITQGSHPTIGNFLLPGMNSFHTTVLTFTGCWDKLKAVPNFLRTIKFNTTYTEIEILTFNVKEKIGYHNNATLKYEAIRLPFKSEEFAMAIVLPYQNYSLESFKKFNYEQYRQLLESVNKNHENIEYAIPFMDSTMIKLDENGASMNGDDPIICEWSTTREIRQEGQIDGFKQFYVNRPFGLFIYEEKTKHVMTFMLVGNPTSGLTAYRNFSGGINPRFKDVFTKIRSFVVFY